MKHPVAERYHRLTTRQSVLQSKLRKLREEQHALYESALAESITCTRLALSACLLEASCTNIATLKIEVQCLLDFVTERSAWSKEGSEALEELCKEFRENRARISPNANAGSRAILAHAAASFIRIGAAID